MNEKTELSVFCKNIKMLREKENLSRVYMAKLLGISVISLIMIEKGILPKRVSCNILFNIYYYFGIVPKDMFCKINYIDETEH